MGFVTKYEFPISCFRLATRLTRGQMPACSFPAKMWPCSQNWCDTFSQFWRSQICPRNLIPRKTEIPTTFLEEPILNAVSWKSRRLRRISRWVDVTVSQFKGQIIKIIAKTAFETSFCARVLYQSTKITTDFNYNIYQVVLSIRSYVGDKIILRGLFFI